MSHGISPSDNPLVREGASSHRAPRHVTSDDIRIIIKNLQWRRAAQVEELGVVLNEVDELNTLIVEWEHKLHVADSDEEDRWAELDPSKYERESTSKGKGKGKARE